MFKLRYSFSSLINNTKTMLHSTAAPQSGVYFKDGKGYDSFRPVYPSKFIEKIRKAPKNYDNYLDLATGTGQVFYQTYDCFSKLSVGADVSQNLLRVAEEKANQLKTSLKPGQELKFAHGDCQKIDELLKTNQIEDKFNLITIGEAFHWFDMEALLKTIKERLIEKEGVLAILSYVINDIELISQNAELKRKVSEAYSKFYVDTTFYSKFDQKVLVSGYKDVPFEKYFTLEKETEVEKIPSSVDDIIGHLGTWSMYNTYVEKHSHESEYQDPLKVIREVLEAAQNEVIANENLPDPTKPFYFVIPYQLILARNSI